MLDFDRTQYRALVVDTPPGVEPITAAELKLFLEIESSETRWDDLLDALIVTARQHAEEYLGAALITTVFVASYDRVPMGVSPWWDGVRELPVTAVQEVGREIPVPRWPLQSVASVDFIDDDDTATTADASSYYVDTARVPPRVVLRFGQVWPTVNLRPANGVQVTFTAGYGDAAEDVPQQIRQALIMMAAYLFEHRGACDPGDAARRSGALGLLGQYKVRRT